jgi:cytochrome P450
LIKNPVLRYLDQYNLYSPGTSAVVRFAQARIAERFAEPNDAKIKSGPNGAVKKSRGDLLEQFLKAKADHPEFMTDERVLVMATSMAFAGSETTAISLAATFYYLLRNPASLTKLRAELDQAVTDGRLRPVIDSKGMVTWAEAQRLPYLDACIKEAFRLHPAAGLPLERIVPESGAEIAGQFVPGGTIVGCSAWVLHKREDLFGSEVDVFRPERWTEAAPERRKEMEGHMFQFGMGSRTCIGKNISLLEVYKLVPSFLRRFEVSLQRG